MSWMITDRTELSGTCYIEVLPGRYENRCWNPQSVFFAEEHFCFIEPTIIRHCAEHDHYSFTDIDRSKWQHILADLEQFANEVDASSQLPDTNGVVKLGPETRKSSPFQSEGEDVASLREMLLGFTRWVRQTLESHDTIAVLGI